MISVCFLFTLASIASIIPVNSGNVTFSKILDDCEDWSHPFIDQETHESYESVLAFEAKKWNIKLYDEKLTFLNSTVIMDAHDLISGYYFENANFNYKVIKRQLSSSLRNFTDEEKAVIYKIRNIVRKLNDFCSNLKMTSNKVQFPSKIKICTSVCGREADFCLELNKLD